MKNVLMIIVMCFMMMLSGCSFWQIKTTPEINAIAEIAARRIGVYVAQNENTNIATINKYCDQALKADSANLEEMTLFGLRYLADKYTGDKLLADDLVSVMKLLGVNLEDETMGLDMGEIATLRAIITAFQTGLNG